jgi:hypothetical protein
MIPRVFTQSSWWSPDTRHDCATCVPTGIKPFRLEHEACGSEQKE